MKSPIIVIRDTREKDGQGWVFSPETKKTGRMQIAGTETTCLETGDYSIKGLEDTFAIERKQGFNELYTNLTNAEDKDRFYAEMERLSIFKYKYLIVETSLTSDMMGLALPQHKYGPPISRLVRDIFDIQIKFGVVPIFAGDAGKKVARYIIEEVLKDVNKRPG